MPNYIHGFKIDNGEIYFFLKNTSNDNIVFYEKVTNEALNIAEKYLEQLKG